MTFLFLFDAYKLSLFVKRWIYRSVNEFYLYIKKLYLLETHFLLSHKVCEIIGPVLLVLDGDNWLNK